MKSNAELEEIFITMCREKGGGEQAISELNKYYTNPIAKMLSLIHHHHPVNEKIIYKEEDVLDLLRRLGYEVEFK